MDNQKLQRIISISDEVNEFHPLLKLLLPKLPGVRRTEYTHGSLEHGADFVLQREELTIGADLYCGLIVKCGNINKGETQNVIEQVRECDGERHFDGGKQKIRLDEIWVVTNGAITTSSQDLIYAQFASKKILFVDRERVVKLIDKHLPSFWTDVDMHIGNYLSSLLKEIEADDKELSLIPHVDSFYIEQEVVKFRTKDFTSKKRQLPKPESKKILDELKTENFLIVEGEAGVGKSKFGRELAKQFCDPKVFNARHTIPITIHCRTLFETHDGDLHKARAHELAQYPEVRDNCDDEILFIVDGLDELKQKGDEATKQIKTISDQLTPSCKMRVVILSRPLTSEYGFAINTASATRLELRPLSLGKTIDFIKKLCSNLSVSNRIFEDLKKSVLFQQLPRSPIAAILLARILREKVIDLPSTLPELYSKYFELALGKWDIKHGLQSDKEYEALDNILMQIATYMLENQLDEICLEEATGMFDAYLAKRNLIGITTKGLIDLVTRRCPVLVVNEQENKFAFKHRTFAEFLFAKNLKEHHPASQSKQVLPKAFEPYWMNTVYFYTGLERDCPEFIGGLIATTPENEFQHWMKALQMSEFMLAGYSTPYDVITGGVERSALDLAQIFLNVRDGKSSLGLDIHPEMTTLYILQYIYKKRYGFEFFAKAIEESVLNVTASTQHPHDLKVYAVFFLCMAYKHIKGGEKGLADVIKDELQPLPLSVQLALTCEIKDVKAKDKALKKFDKRVIERANNDPKTNFLVNELFDKPIEKRNLQLANKDSKSKR